jgi:hypothetical protein
MPRARLIASAVISAVLIPAAALAAVSAPGQDPARAALVLPAGDASPGTIYACVTGTQRLVNVNTASPEPCPSGAYPVSWAGTVPAPPSPSPSPTATSPSPSPTATSPSPSPTATSPSPSPTVTACVTSAPAGSCGPYSYPGITGSNGYNTYILNNMWAAGGTSTTQVLTAYDPGNWSALADAPAGNTSVLTYPDTQQIYTRTDNTPAPLTSFTSLASTFAETMNPQPGTSAEAAFDIWAGQSAATNYADEIMIWTDTVARGTCGGAVPQASGVLFGGQSWNLCKWGSSELIWYLAGANEQSGTVDILAMMNWLVSNGYLPGGTGLNQVDYGFEICSTGGLPENFSVSSYGIAGS